MNRKITYVTFVVDESSSMAPFMYKVPEMYRDLVTTLKERAEVEKQEVKIAVTKFADYITKPQGFTPTGAVVNWNLNYNPNGNTALLQAVDDAMTEHENVRHSILDDVAHLIIVLTDGEENASWKSLGQWSNDFRTNKQAFADRLRRLQATNRYTFAFNMPRGKSDAFARQYNVPIENCREWEQTEQGFHETRRATATAATEYMTARAKGATYSTNFYHTTTDLSNVTKADLKDCDNFTRVLRPIAVPREVDIKSFVQSETGKPYIRGTAFYQLTKPEEIQGNKDVIIKEKTANALWGGPKAREILGLQPYRTGKVRPGNHANFDIFVQSTSDNRKLVRGTKVLVTT